MTLQECKDQVARENLFEDWNDWKNQSVEVVGMPHIPFAFHDRVSQLYGDSQWNGGLDKIEIYVRNEVEISSDDDSYKALGRVLKELKRLKR